MPDPIRVENAGLLAGLPLTNPVNPVAARAIALPFVDGFAERRVSCGLLSQQEYPQRAGRHCRYA